MKKLAVVITHPIQYYAPLFQLWTQRPGIQLKVFYTWSQSSSGSKFDPDFGKTIEWDIPLLKGYDFEFVENVSRNPGSHHFKGIDNPGLLYRIKEWNPNTILVIGWSFKSHLACIRYFKGKIPVIFRGDSTLLDDKPGFKKLLRRIFLTWVYRHVDYALYVGENNKEYFLAHGLRPAQLVFAPHAIDNLRFSADASQFEMQAKNWKRELGISDNDFVLVFAGKLEEKKDPDFVLRLAKLIPAENVKFVIVGNGKLEAALKRNAEGDKRIIFIDFQNQQKMPLVYRLADVFLLPSLRNETWGLAINEAMACQRPVIASTKVGCTPDLVIDSTTGWKFEQGERSSEKVAAIIMSLLQNRTVLTKMGKMAYARIQYYSYEAITTATFDLIEKIA